MTGVSIKRAGLILLAAAALFAQQSRVKRPSLAMAEKNCDSRIGQVVENQFGVLGPSRASYVEGFGAMLSAEVDLFPGPSVSPFHLTISPADVARVHAGKLARLPKLRQCMRDILMSTAASLDEVAPQERIALSVTLLFQAYENTSGLPSQIVMQGERGKLVDAKLGRIPVESVVKVQEF
jgi:hypothetical protein